MDLRDMTVRQIQEALENGSVNEEDVAELDGLLGQGARAHRTLRESHLIYPDRTEFINAFAEALRDPRCGSPPERGKTAAVMGCDPKTLCSRPNGAVQRHLGVRTWRDVQARIIRAGLAAIAVQIAKGSPRE